jgi:hypothetical protein
LPLYGAFLNKIIMNRDYPLEKARNPIRAYGLPREDTTSNGTGIGINKNYHA